MKSATLTPESTASRPLGWFEMPPLPKKIFAKTVDPTARLVGRLLRPIVHAPKRQVNKLRSKLTWKNLQGPLSAAAAVVLGGLAAVFSQMSTGVALNPASVMSITTIVMELGSTEKFYVRSILRIIGTLIGAACGFGFGAVAVLIAGSTRAGMQDPEYIAAESFRLSMAAIVALITFSGMKFYERVSHAFMMFGVTFFSVLYTETYISAATAVLSAIAGVMCSILTILMFQFPKADVMLAETHRGAVESLFTLVRFAIEADPRCMDDFDDCATTVRKALTSTQASFQIYAQWRRWTRRTVIHDFDQLSRATRPLYYVSYCMYWSLVEAPSAASDIGGIYLFCNDQSQYMKYFQQARILLEGAIMSIQASLTLILVHDPKDTVPPQHHLEIIVSRHLWHGCMRSIHILKEAYIEHREECFSSIGQRWSYIEYINRSIALTLAVVAYVNAIAGIFLPEIAQYIYPMLEDICENLSQIRNESGLRDGTNVTRTNTVSRTVSGMTTPHTNRVPRGMGIFEDDNDTPTEYPTYPGTLNRYTYARMRREAGSNLSPVSSGENTASPQPSKRRISDP